MSPRPGATRAASASSSECHSCDFRWEISLYVQMVTDFHFWGAKSGKTRLWVFQKLMCLQTRHLLCLQTRHLLCQQTRHLLCQQTRHLWSPKTSPRHWLHRGGRFAAAPVWAMKRGCLGRPQMSCLLAQQMSCLLTQQMSRLQTQQMSYLQTQDFRPVAPSGGGCCILDPIF